MNSPGLSRGFLSKELVSFSMGLIRNCISVTEEIEISTVMSRPCQQSSLSPESPPSVCCRNCSAQRQSSFPPIAVSQASHFWSESFAHILSGCLFCLSLDARVSEGLLSILLPRSRCISFSPGRSMRSRQRVLTSFRVALCSCLRIFFKHFRRSAIPSCNESRHRVQETSGDVLSGRGIALTPSLAFQLLILRIECVICTFGPACGAIAISLSKVLICLFSRLPAAESWGGRRCVVPPR